MSFSAPLPTVKHRLEHFARLGLRWNPFRVAERSEVPELFVPGPRGSGWRVDEILGSDATVTQIIGPRGRGKSTLLAALGDRLRVDAVPFDHCYLQPEGPFRVQPPPRTDSRFLLIDEAQRLSWRGRREVLRWLRHAGRRLIATTHAALRLRCGTGETVALEFPGVNVSRLQSLFRARIAWAGGDPKRFGLTEEAACWLIERCGDNLRLMEMGLYELFQSLEPADHITITTVSLDPFAAKIDAFAAEAARAAAAHK